MYNSDTELLFPVRLIPGLGALRGETWKNLVDGLSGADPDPLGQLGFVLMMVRLNGCVACNADSYRAMRGCTQCARQTIRRFRGNDAELLEQFEQARLEVENYQQKQSANSRNSGS
ncbi:MAG: hypothetical protein P4L50_26075 [Anaerolineaceae bacterium]|nr:hypothetical protein [Anaerolineaceae bacterium]